jgi:hypothetical protein
VNRSFRFWLATVGGALVIGAVTGGPTWAAVGFATLYYVLRPGDDDAR